MGIRHPKAQPLGTGIAAAVSPESLGSCPHIWCQLHVLSQILPGPSLTFVWKFGVETVQGCRMEKGRLSLLSAAHPQAELEVGFSIPPCEKSSSLSKPKHNNSLGEALKA